MTLPYQGEAFELPATDGYMTTSGTHLRARDGKTWAYCGSDCTKEEWEAYQRLWLAYHKTHKDVMRIRQLESVIDWLWAHVAIALLIGIVIGALMCKYVRD